MNCRQLSELLVDYVSGELPPEQSDHFRRHLCQCPPCVVYLETYQLTIRLSRQLPAVAPPPQLLQRLRAALGESGTGQAPAQA
jgi:anti-sigma factor RsiW